MTKLFAATALVASICCAQGQKASPHETVSTTIDGSKVTISYGRPYLKGRVAVGGQLVPYGQVWRLGADEATKLTTVTDLKIGDLAVPKGSYSLFVLPEANGWTLIVNKTADQWGAFSYDKSADLGRVPMHTGKLDGKVEQFTITIDKGRLWMNWENTEADVPFTGK